MGFALDKARHPERLHFRVLQAMEENHDVSCAIAFLNGPLERFCERQPDPAACRSGILGRTKIWTIPRKEGMGPAHQRGLLNELLDYQERDAFCMTTDSHMDFRPDYDELTVADWLATENEFAVLTAYPMAMMPNQDEQFAGCHVDLCGYFLEAGVPRGKTGGNNPTYPGDKPYLTMNWAAGFSFHRCHADHNVPVDKHLRFIFTGEEISRAVRLWTHGYDLYLPSAVNIYHDYKAAKQEFWSYNTRAGDSKHSRQRLATLLQLDRSVAPTLPAEKLEPYGLGQQRTLEQWVEWSRVNLGKRWLKFLSDKGKKPVEGQTAVGQHWFCQTLERVPVRDIELLNASISAHGAPPGADPEASPAKRVQLGQPGEL